jgi:ABC-type sugar transport system ATPase subunit
LIRPSTSCDHRPEDLDIAGAGAADFQVHVDVVEPLGKESLLHVLAPQREGSAPVELRVLAPGGAAPRSGATLGVRLRRDRLHLFDPATERRLSPADAT